MARKKRSSSSKKDAKAQPGFEEAMDRIEGIIKQIETGEVGLEKSLEQYASGIKLIRYCRGVLDRAESKIQELAVDLEVHEEEEGARERGS